MSAVPTADLARRFKRIEGGFAFKPPSNIFHRTQTYRVTEVEKTEILALMKVEKGRWTPWVMRSAIVLSIASGVAVGQASSPWHGFVVGYSVSFLVLIIGEMMVGSATTRRLQPLLARLPFVCESETPSKGGYLLPVPSAAASTPASDAELLALGKKLNPLFERWSRQVEPLGHGVTVPAREKAGKPSERGTTG